MRRLVLLLVTATAAGVIVVGLASATKPAPGGVTGVGSVFVPNPVQSLGDESLTDQKDRTRPSRPRPTSGSRSRISTEAVT